MQISSGWHLFVQPNGAKRAFWVEPVEHGDPMPWAALYLSPAHVSPLQEVARISPTAWQPTSTTLLASCVRTPQY